MSEIITHLQNNKCLKIMLKKIWGYLLVAALVFAICSFYAAGQVTGSRSVAITVNSASASGGQNPDGSAFDIYQILSDEVLEAASEKLEGKISAAELRDHLSVSDALRAETNQQLKQSIVDGQYENIYFPTVYRLTYSKVSANGEKSGAFSGKPGMNRILEAVAESYQEFYEASYLSYGSMFVIDWERIDEMDYYNRAEALRTEAMRFVRFLQEKANENPAAGSFSANLTYGDLCNDLWQVINNDIENHQAYIIQNNITESRPALLRQFRYMEEIYIEEKERKTEEYLILSDAVDMYDASTTKVVFIPALDQDDLFYMNRTKVGLDYLVESADAARLAADEAEHQAQYYQYLQTCFQESVIPLQSQIAHADEVYLNIKDRIQGLVESVKLLTAESNQTGNEGIKIGGVEANVSLVGVGMSFAKRFVILSMVAYVLLYIPSSLYRKKHDRLQEV